MLLEVLHSLLHRLVHAPLPHARDPYAGMDPAWYSFTMSTLSGISLPLGAGLGIMLSPVSDKACGMMMAFGAGALLFAVTVELYGRALKELVEGELGVMELFTTIFGALAGAAFYIVINRWLEEYLMRDGEQDEENDPLTPASPQQEASTKETDSLMGALLSSRHAEFVKQSTPNAEPLTITQRVQKQFSLVRQQVANRPRAREKVMTAIHETREAKHAKSVALAMFLGLLVDGVPEGVLMGFLCAEGHLTPVLVVSLFVANFPEAFSSASLLIQARMSTLRIMLMWTGLCIVVGCLGGVSCWLLLLHFPHDGRGGLGEDGLPMSVRLMISLVEGITGGAMIACVACVMLPEAFERAGKNVGPFYSNSGFLCTSGFLASVALKALFG